MRRKSSLVLTILFAIIAAAPAISQNEQRFKSAAVGIPIELPHDHGAHPEYQTEWWYFTGQLFTQGKRPHIDPADYGFQLTFFRRGSSTKSGATFEQQYLAHAALTLVKERRYLHNEKHAPAALGLAGAAEDRLKVWNHDWSVIGDGPLELKFSVTDESGRAITAALTAEIASPALLHGAAGFSRKGECAGCASHYYSLPRLKISGALALPEATISVHGLAWMDHEYMSSALDSAQVGWDWFSLLGANGEELMLFVLRRADGSVDFASGTLRAQGMTAALGREDFTIEVQERWKSPATGGDYPARWRIVLPKHKIDISAAPLFPAQEFTSKGAAGVTYWEGAIAASDQHWLGYAELTGYAGSIEGKL